MDEEDTDLDFAIDGDNGIIEDQAENNSFSDTPQKVVEQKLSSALIIG